MKGIEGALLRYRVMAWITGAFLLTLTIWLILGYTVWGYGDGAVKPAAYAMMWTGHGWLYFIYLITGVDLTFRARWSLGATIGVLVAGTIPLASFFAEHWVTKRVRAASGVADVRDSSTSAQSPTP